jgi:hypothetical protein
LKECGQKWEELALILDTEGSYVGQEVQGVKEGDTSPIRLFEIQAWISQGFRSTRQEGISIPSSESIQKVFPLDVHHPLEKTNITNHSNDISTMMSFHLVSIQQLKKKLLSDLSLRRSLQEKFAIMRSHISVGRSEKSVIA